MARKTAKPRESSEIPAPRHRRRRKNWLAALVALAVLLFGGWMFHRWRVGGGGGGTESPDIILVTIDTLRADSLGFAGNTRVRTPFLDSLAKQGVVFTNAHAHNVVTLSSHVNILTGLYPYQHGVRDNAGFILHPSQHTLAELLKQQKGYTTGAFIGAFPLDARYGLNQGFDVYDDKYPEGSNRMDFIIAERPATEVLQAARTWWESMQGRKRFLWIHLYDPHAPYKPPGRFAAEYLADPYLGEVAATDEALGEFLSPILAGKEKPFVVVTSDHGEALGDHGEMTHGLFAYEATLKVPLLIVEPGALKSRVENRSVRHIDIAPTILARVGATPIPVMPGGSLLEISAPRDSYFEALSASMNRGWAPLIGLIHEDRKYIDLPLPELYDLPKDPGERKNLFKDDRRTVVKIRNLLAQAAPNTKAVDRNISQEEGAKLLSLGYITGTSSKTSYSVDDDPKNLVDLDTKMHQVIELYQLGQLDRAARLAKETLDRRPDMQIMREIYALLLQQSEKSDAAIATLRESIKQGDRSESTRRRLGLVLSESGKAKEAVELLAAFADSSDPEILNAYGIALADVGRIPEAVKQFEKVLVIDATNALAYQNLGIVALRARQPQRAEGYLAKALELNPNLPLALNTRGVIHAQKGEVEPALAAWSKAVQIDSTQYDALFNIAMVAGKAGKHLAARQALERFIQTAPPQRYARDIAAAKKMLASMPRG